MKNHYEILEVKRNATQQEIKKAYRLKANKYHPDKNQGCKEAESQFKKIEEAYRILYNENKRRKYDLELSLQENREFFSKKSNDSAYSSTKRYAYNFNQEILRKKQEAELWTLGLKVLFSIFTK